MDDRDRKLDTARRLGKGVVALGVAGSLGVAGLLGLSAVQHSARSASPAQAPSTNPTSGAQQAAPSSGDDGGGSDDGWSFPSGQNAQPPSLQQGGTGAPHGTTSGS